jgi:hypothetical protein
MSAEKLRNVAKIPGMTDLIGSLGIELINDIADSYSDMYEALKKIIKDSYLDEYGDYVGPIEAAEQALAKAKGE